MNQRAGKFGCCLPPERSLNRSERVLETNLSTRRSPKLATCARFQVRDLGDTVNVQEPGNDVDRTGVTVAYNIVNYKPLQSFNSWSWRRSSKSA